MSAGKVQSQLRRLLDREHRIVLDRDGRNAELGEAGEQRIAVGGHGVEIASSRGDVDNRAVIN